MRPVTYFKYEKVDGDTQYTPKSKIEKGPAIFAGYGLEYNEDGTYSSYTAAIIEKPDGTVELIPVDMIKFTDIGEQNAKRQP